MWNLRKDTDVDVSNYISLILSHYTCEMYSNYPEINLVSEVWMIKICRQALSSMQPKKNILSRGEDMQDRF